MDWSDDFEHLRYAILSTEESLERPTTIVRKSKPGIPFPPSSDIQYAGVGSNYDENFYTTNINRSNPHYAERVARAEKLAREIERGSAPDVNVDQDMVGDPVENTTGNQKERLRSDREEIHVTGYEDAPNAYRSDHMTSAPYPHEIGSSACENRGKVFSQIRRLR